MVVKRERKDAHMHTREREGERDGAHPFFPTQNPTSPAVPDWVQHWMYANVSSSAALRQAN
eukprot:m.72319 g.72319  ORF g.72319 m.72319 type:complete len:61 (+) comp16955_c0_seq4:592-774(+)